MIYFVSDGEYVKIGFTDNDDIDRRLTALQIGNARKLVLLGAIEGSRESETTLHNIFEGLRVRGEWFKVTLPEDIIDSEIEGREYHCIDCGQTFGTVQALNAHGRWCKARVSMNGSAK